MNTHTLLKKNAIIMILVILLLSISRELLFAQNDGKNDSTFNKYVTSSYGNVYNIKLQQDGKIIVAAVSSTTFNIIRYNSDGSIDSTFNSTGIFTRSGSASGLEILPDGKILVSGANYGTNADIIIYKINSNGLLDNTFGVNGKVTTQFGTGINEYASSIIIQPDGKFVIGGGYRSASFIYKMMLVRYNANGIIDNTFGNSGTVLHTITGGDCAISRLALQNDGSILAGGYSKDSSNYSSYAVILRFSSNGILDGTFNYPGGVGDLVKSLLLQPDGKILLLGEYTYYGITRGKIIRRNSNGTLDPSFVNTNTVGNVLYQGTGNMHASAMALQQDGKILMAGGEYNTYYSGNQQHTNSNAIIYRYLSNGTLDTTFGEYSGGHGFVFVPGGSGSVYSGVTALTLQDDGKIVYAGGNLQNGFPMGRLNNSWINVTGVNEKSVTENIFIYPNPASDFLNVKFNSETDQKSASLIIKNSLGKIIYNEQLSIPQGEYTKELNISQFAKGVYFVSVEMGKKETKKLVIMK